MYLIALIMLSISLNSKRFTDKLNWGHKAFSLPPRLCHYLYNLLPDSQFLCWSHSAMGSSACWKRWRKCSICPYHLGVMSCMCPAEHMMICQYAAHHINRAGLLHWTHNPKVVHVFVLLCHVLWPEVQLHSDNSHVHATAPCSVAYVCPTMSCIPLVISCEWAFPVHMQWM